VAREKEKGNKMTIEECKRKRPPWLAAISPPPVRQKKTGGGQDSHGHSTP